MKKAIILLLVILTVISLVACGDSGEQKADTPAATESAATTAEEATSEPDFNQAGLSEFVDDHCIYFDLQITDESIKDFSLTVGSETLTESKQIAFNQDDAITQNGEPVEGKKFTVYILREIKSDEGITVDHFINVGIRADKLGDMLAKTYQSRLTGSTKVYIAVLESADGWNHNLSSKLNDYLTSIMPKQ